MTVDVATTPDGARIDVADTGIGIDPAELPHIFERFYRGARSNEARGSGSGLGLAIVRSIVDMHGGGVTVESSAGAGSRFSVDLPRDPRTVAGTPAADPGRRGHRRRGAGSHRRGRWRPGRGPSCAGRSGRPIPCRRGPTTPRPRPPTPSSPEAADASDGNVTETSPSEPPRMNPASAP